MTSTCALTPQSRHPLRAFCAAALLTALAAPSGALAATPGLSYSASAYVNAWASMHSGTVTDAPVPISVSTTNALQPLQVSTQAAILDPGPVLTESAGGTGSVSVGAGGLHMSAFGSASVQGGSESFDTGGAQGYGYASGGFSDTTIWNVNGVAAGQVISVDFQIRVDGATGVNMVKLQGGTASGFRIYDWDLRFASLGQHYVINSDQDDDFGVFSFTAQVMVGAPVTLSMSGSVAGSGQAGIMCSSFYGFICDEFAHGASASGFADLGHTLAWNGVTGLRLGETALSLSALSVTSGSGFDYAHAYVDAVPEPGSGVLLGVGLLALPWLRGRVKRQ